MGKLIIVLIKNTTDTAVKSSSSIPRRPGTALSFYL